MGPVVAVIALIVVIVGVALWLRSQRSGPPRSATPTPGRPASQAGSRPNPGRPTTPQPTPEPDLSRRNWLVGLSGEIAGKSYHVGARNFTIGRHTSNFVQLTDPLVSRVHAQIRAEDGQVVIADMESKGGLRVNGQSIRETVLMDGDEIELGGTRLRFVAVMTEAAANAAFERKAVDTRVHQQTLALEPGARTGLVLATVQQNNGDLKKSADMLGMELEDLKRVLGIPK